MSRASQPALTMRQRRRLLYRSSTVLSVAVEAGAPGHGPVVGVAATNASGPALPATADYANVDDPDGGGTVVSVWVVVVGVEQMTAAH